MYLWILVNLPMRFYKWSRKVKIWNSKLYDLKPTGFQLPCWINRKDLPKSIRTSRYSTIIWLQTHVQESHNEELIKRALLIQCAIYVHARKIKVSLPREHSVNKNLIGYSKKNNQRIEIENTTETYSNKFTQTDYSNKTPPSSYRDSRCIKISNRGSQLGIQLIGGNKYGIFISSMLENSPAFMSGLKIGDQIVSVNGVEFTEITREDAVMYLLSLKNDMINFVCVNRMASTWFVTSAFEKIKFQQCDEFYIR